jgi:hypothetical protein
LFLRLYARPIYHVFLFFPLFLTHHILAFLCRPTIMIIASFPFLFFVVRLREISLYLSHNWFLNYSHYSFLHTYLSYSISNWLDHCTQWLGHLESLWPSKTTYTIKNS